MKLAVATCAAIALAMLAFDAEAGRGGGRGHAAGGSSGAHHFPRHPHGRVFVGTTFVGWPPAYYWPGYYYAPAADMPAPQYWYYCAAAAAYYPYVQNCPGGWELVMPSYPGD